MNLQDIRNLIGQGDTAGAIKALVSRVQEGAGRNQRLRDDLLILSNRFEELKRKESIGLLEQDDAMREHTQVNEALLNLLADMESERPVLKETSTATGAARKISVWWVVAVAILLAGAAAWYFVIKPPAPKASIIANTSTCFIPCIIVFTNQSEHADHFVWFVDGAKVGTTQHLRYNFTTAGSHAVMLTAYSGELSDSKTIFITCQEPPKPREKSIEYQELVFRLTGMTQLLNEHSNSMNNEDALTLENYLRGWNIGGRKNLEGQSTESLTLTVKNNYPLSINWDQLSNDYQKIRQIVNARRGGRHFGAPQEMDYATLRQINVRLKNTLNVLE